LQICESLENLAMALKKVKGNLERMFDKSLTDLVRGIRNNKDDEVSKLYTFEPYTFEPYTFESVII